jgi:colicin import membrane protein
MAATADNFTTPNERAISGAMALVMHALFFALLVFSVTWQKRQPEAPVMAEIWNNLPPIAAPKTEPAPEVKPEPTPPKPEPKPEPRVEAKPVPKAEPKPVPKAEPKPTIKPDIALKDKKEKERKAAEQALAEKKKREQEQAAAVKAQQAKEAEAKQAAREQEEGLKKLAAQQAAAQSRVVDEYKRRIADKIKRFIVEPPNLQGNPEVEMDVVLLPGGEVLGVKTRRASAMSAWDNAVERAIIKAQPLPLPPDPAMFKDFRELNLKFRPKE